MDSMVLERFEESIGARFFNGDEQSARSLGIIKQISEFLGDIFREDRASFDELAIILQTTGQKSGLRRCNGSGQILDARVIETKGYAAAERHLSCVPEDSEAGYVGHGMNCRIAGIAGREPDRGDEVMERIRSVFIEAAHRVARRDDGFFRSSALLEGCRDHARADGLGEN